MVSRNQIEDLDPYPLAFSPVGNLKARIGQSPYGDIGQLVTSRAETNTNGLTRPRVSTHAGLERNGLRIAGNDAATDVRDDALYGPEERIGIPDESICRTRSIQFANVTLPEISGEDDTADEDHQASCECIRVISHRPKSTNLKWFTGRLIRGRGECPEQVTMVARAGADSNLRGLSLRV